MRYILFSTLATSFENSFSLLPTFNSLFFFFNTWIVLQSDNIGVCVGLLDPGKVSVLLLVLATQVFV